MSCFSELLKSGPEFASVKYAVERERFPFGALGLPPATKHLLIHTLCETFSRGAVVLLPDEAAAMRCRQDLCAFGTNAVLLPARDLNFRSAESSSKEYEQKRIGALANIITGKAQVLVASVEAALLRTLPPDVLRQRTFTLKKWQTLPPAVIVARLLSAGYSPAQLVEGAGQFSQRGGILDVYPTNSPQPVRIEFYGDDIDTISYFDTVSQRRTDFVGEVTVAPCSEVLFDDPGALAVQLRALKKGLRGKAADEARQNLDRDADLLESGVIPGAMDKYMPVVYREMTTVFDYLPDAFLVVCDSAAVKEHAVGAAKLMNEEIREAFLDGALCRGLETFGIDFAALTALYEERRTVYMDNFARGSFDTPVKELVNYSINQLSRWDGSYRFLREDLEPALRQKYTAVVFAGTEKAAKNLTDTLVSDGIPAVYHAKVPGLFQKGWVNLLPGGISGGVDYPGGKVTVVTFGTDALAARRKSVRVKKDPGAFQSLDELQPGDYVVHVTHGIGVFDGIEKKETDHVIKDYLKIRYAKGDVLYVPVTKLERVTRYIGPHEEGAKAIKLNRLGSGDWERTKTRVRGAVKDIAEKLIRIYAERQNSAGFAFSPDIDMQNDFERRFEYDETEDQLRCIAEIKADMEKHCPMDRLLCGDVGFGKTEVALRAAFKAVCDGKQVAILVPTTILALQHYRTIRHRMEGFPVNVDMLSRFRSHKEQKSTLAFVKSGGVDILVGTHRIISKDVEFKDLGLLIVDEEQRFGVEQKEKLKEKFPGVDVLTLSATPIPRTLNFAMMGIRDLSVIEEAPLDRHPVQTYVVEHDWSILEPAIAKELRRGGQVYYLHNRIDDIDDTAAGIRKLFPDARIGIAHGKMTEAQLSGVWRGVLEGEIDILVCTTIIETGVDVANVNTLIIENADRMGLAQLHQLRGRVGRSARRAVAYMTFHPGKELSEIADKRLSAIREFTQFGAGFKIAMRDMEIRGAGNLLGAQQHGHIAEVGYDLYIQMLTEAVAALKGDKKLAPKRECLVDLQINAYIPDDYITSYPQRIAIYKRIADIHTPDDAMDVTDELIDRYGDPPESVTGLIRVALLKNAAADNGITEITQLGQRLLLHIPKIDHAIFAKLAVLKGRVTVNVTGKTPFYAVRMLPGQTPIEGLEEVAKALADAKL
ncbi:MAG: transcription-repair coupling factor [Clostridia bacterium]|nr:transcription-repair coupling factor [Clostridia bacterium]